MRFLYILESLLYIFLLPHNGKTIIKVLEYINFQPKFSYHFKCYLDRILQFIDTERFIL